MILPLLISLLQDGAIASCFATLKKAERKLQLHLHTYQEGEFLAGGAVVFGSEHPHKTETCFKAEKKIILSCPHFLYALLHCVMLSLIWDNVVIKSSWFPLCCFDSEAVSKAGACKKRAGRTNRTMGRRGFPFWNETQPEACNVIGVTDGMCDQTTRVYCPHWTVQSLESNKIPFISKCDRNISLLK